jgi:hypothetical protein
MKKIILTSFLSIAAIALFSFASSKISTLEVTNGTSNTIDEFWTGYADTDKWEYKWTGGEPCAPGGSFTLTGANHDKSFWILTHDVKKKKFHAYGPFPASGVQKCNLTDDGELDPDSPMLKMARAE